MAIQKGPANLGAASVDSTELSNTLDLSAKTVTYRTIVAGDIASNAITTAKITDANITTAKVADTAITPAKMANSGAEFGMRNRIINGSFDIWQRNTTFGPGGSLWGQDGTYHTDRWYTGDPGFTTITREVNDRVSHLPYMIKGVASSAGYMIIGQRIEDVRIFSGKTITISLWYKSNTTESVRLYCIQKFGTGGSTAVTVVDNASYFTGIQANVWQKLTATITLPSVAGKTIGAGNNLDIGIGRSSGTSGNIQYFSEVQCEEGSVATPFEYRPYGTELALCQRYYAKLGYKSGAFIGSGNTYAGGLGAAYVKYPVTMRANPTAAFSNLSGGDGYNYGRTVTSFGSSQIGPDSAQIALNVTAADMVASRVFVVYPATDAGYLDFSAEL